MKIVAPARLHVSRPHVCFEKWQVAGRRKDKDSLIGFKMGWSGGGVEVGGECTRSRREVERSIRLGQSSNMHGCKTTSERCYQLTAMPL
mmetsp:Transcript_50226/g.129298  ORF Transcript_50226/g.129298 Transcript_50226/m.129298 type:complete len:89 (+) Transcript_50226:149-415(+)